MRSFELPQHDARLKAAACLTPERVLERCRDTLVDIDADERQQWTQCHGLEAIYQPGRAVCAAFVLLADPSMAPDRYWAEGRIIYLRAPVREPVSRRGRVVQIGGQRFELYRFPNDRRLTGLRHTTARDSTAALWHQCAGHDAPTPNNLQRYLIKYVPERKYVARIRCRDEAAPNRRLRNGVAIRLCRGGAAETLAQRHAHAHRNAETRKLPIKFPTVLACDARRDLLAVTWIKGRSILEILPDDLDSAIWPRCAEALDAFHHLDLPQLPRVTLDTLVQSVGRMSGDLATCLPSLTREFSTLASRISETLEAYPPADPVTLHNDWHFDQLRLQSRRSAILDLERISRGDPMIDIANFTVQLRMLGVRDDYDLSPEAAATYARACLHAHGSPHVGEAARRFRAYAAISALTLAWGMLRHLRPGWRRLAQQALKEADFWFERHTATLPAT